MLSSQFVIRNNICRVLKMIIPVYNSSEEEIGSSTGVPGHSTMNPSSAGAQLGKFFKNKSAFLRV